MIIYITEFTDVDIKNNGKNNIMTRTELGKLLESKRIQNILKTRNHDKH